jgi:DNA-binding MarR family transcriptional regulator
MKSNTRIKKSTFPPLLHLSYVLQQSAEEKLGAETGIGLSAARIMSVLERQSPVSQRLIAVELRQTEANVSRQLQSMKKHGFVSIIRNKKDSRQRDVSPTAKGTNIYMQASKVLKQQQRQFVKLLSESESDVLELMAEKFS